LIDALISPWLLLSLSEIAAAVFVVFLGGAVRGATGFGGAMVMTLPLSIFFKPAEAILAVLFLELLGPVTILRTALSAVIQNKSAKNTFLLIAVTALLILPLGIWLQNYLDQHRITYVMACVILVCALALIFRFPKNLLNTKFRSITTGAISGLMVALTGIGGAPVVLYIHASESNPQLARFFLMLYVTTISVLMIGASIILLPVGASSLLIAFVMMPIFFTGTLIGYQLTSRFSGPVMKSISLWLLVIGSSAYVIRVSLVV